MIREPAVAGQFYDGNPRTLRENIQSFLVNPESLIEARAILVPHAGYVYSGAVAGAVYGSVRIPERVILLGPNHTGRGVALSLYPTGEWRTPLGLAAVDEGLNRRLLMECPLLAEDRAAHAREHSIEVQIPFLQVLTDALQFAAICVGTTDYASLETLGHGLARVAAASQEPVLLVVSSDMTHYETADGAARKDRLAIEKVMDLDPKGLYRIVLEEDISMCGFAPAVALLVACRDLGVAEGRLIRYACSGDVNGDYQHVVGYAGIAMC
jgi:AmmeMemoRadiSam system protein B